VDAIKRRAARSIMDDLKQSGELEEVVQKILQKEMDPYSVAAQLVAKRLKHHKLH
jgi:anthranilate phosphoribosyltransferase